MGTKDIHPYRGVMEVLGVIIVFAVFLAAVFVVRAVVRFVVTKVFRVGGKGRKRGRGGGAWRSGRGSGGGGGCGGGGCGGG